MVLTVYSVCARLGRKERNRHTKTKKKTLQNFFNIKRTTNDERRMTTIYSEQHIASRLAADDKQHPHEHLSQKRNQNFDDDFCANCKLKISVLFASIILCHHPPTSNRCWYLRERERETETLSLNFHVRYF